MSELMLECLSCGNRTVLDLSPAQMSDIGAAGETWITCARCKRDTNWKAADFGRRSGEDRRRQVGQPLPEQGGLRTSSGVIIAQERRSPMNDRRQALLR